MFKSTLLLALAGLSTFVGAVPLQRRNAGKRGLAFPKEHNGQPGSQWTHQFDWSDQLFWMYNWEAVIIGDAIDLEYVPLLHSNQPWCTEGWFANVAAARQKYRVTSILGFNEPDQAGGGGSNMDVGSAVAAYKQFINPFGKEGLRLGSPAVTNGNEPNKGINWLKQFMAQCSDCQVDFVVAHYYAWDKAEDFKNYLENFHSTFNKPVWVTEFGVTEGNAEQFLKEVLPWMDSQSWIERYAYHMVAPDQGAQFLINAAGNALSAAGQVYASI
ncbi:hypothetical protein IAQ61_004318 [Plenodomus lingam]|uniref:Asl1-like glycosyl hydrolase catalytic domain-containing protein n=1 Tax=Leptosphaeria maculans (strain JN3 / isolate v23.1.3 / race Av1-4-5-6-7-8) TaxID=985895 RepID=E4ZV66_LEPMJ|nr:hypothetical protein LEMA_P026440.1 [Plenodomus lingam JN3]KAH9873692.1 hypothetical protein IAQ61_004318 [Plenodomus lingam]CBX95492.1 hypothetical protein LEMA_P026440.1 [Plenodomus lingam JN3]